IVDQVPAKLTPDVLKNTNLKILHRIVAEDDRESVGNAMNLTREQKEQVVRLRVGQAVVHNEYLDKPVLLQIHGVKDNLREQFERDIGRAGLRQRMLGFQDQVRDIYRRWPGCHSCDAPCTYYSELNAPDASVCEAFLTFLASLMTAAPPAVMEVWRRTRAAIVARLRKRYGGKDPERGVLLCNVVEIAHVTLGEWHQYYRGGSGGHASYLRMEEMLLRALPSMLDDGPVASAAVDSIVAVIEEMRTKVAVEPRRAEPGCQECRRRCWYGFMVQRDLGPKAQVLAERLKTASEDPAFANNYERLVQLTTSFAQEVTPFAVAPHHAASLAFCYLVNSGATRPHVLRGFHQAART